MSILKSDRRGLICSGAVYLLIGFLMCAWPVGTAGVMCFVAGLAIIVSGVLKGAVYFKKKDFGLMPRVDFATAAIQVIIGILLASRPDVFMSLVPFILGILVLVNSVFQMQTARELHMLKYRSWWHHLVVSLVCAVIAITMIFDPFDSYRIVSVFMGLAFLVGGATDLWTALYITRKLRQLGLM